MNSKQRRAFHRILDQQFGQKLDQLIIDARLLNQAYVQITNHHSRSTEFVARPSNRLTVLRKMANYARI